MMTTERDNRYRVTHHDILRRQRESLARTRKWPS